MEVVKFIFDEVFCYWFKCWMLKKKKITFPSLFLNLRKESFNKIQVVGAFGFSFSFWVRECVFFSSRLICRIVCSGFFLLIFSVVGFFRIDEGQSLVWTKMNFLGERNGIESRPTDFLLFIVLIVQQTCFSLLSFSLIFFLFLGFSIFCSFPSSSPWDPLKLLFGWAAG